MAYFTYFRYLLSLTGLNLKVLAHLNLLYASLYRLSTIISQRIEQLFKL